MAVEQRHPSWLKVKLPGGPNYAGLRQLVRASELHTVCEEARCPNIGECWERRAATFMVLGDVCTRACRYCAVTSGRPGGVDLEEPGRLARTVARLGLRYCVITSVDRDDLPDGGAFIFSQCIQQVRDLLPTCQVEVLVPDFQGSWPALQSVLRAGPAVLNHNIETVRRVFHSVRPKGDYDLSLELLHRAKEYAPGIPTKSGLMVGLGETVQEVEETMADLRAVGCDLLTIGQYLRPSLRHVAMDRYYHPDEFSALAMKGYELGFRHVAAGPLVRSSYHADEQAAAAG
uniref:lipoyl synthase n=1 Tax=uncultured marine microorganism HF4000_APKG7H23 TaxID=455551 RepID=B3T9S4_9ZZZZ|nr:putative Radical SAM superfamily protein [uncultured marine microorganism HF4000_APKG7H23]